MSVSLADRHASAGQSVFLMMLLARQISSKMQRISWYMALSSPSSVLHSSIVSSEGKRGADIGSGGRPAQPLVRRRRVPSLSRWSLSACSLACRAARFARISAESSGVEDVTGGSVDTASFGWPFSSTSPKADLFLFFPCSFLFASRKNRPYSLRSFVSSLSLMSQPSPRKMLNISLLGVLTSHN